MADVPINNSSTIINTKNHQFSEKVELTQMLQGGAILEVTNVKQAKIAEEAGACSVVIYDGRSRMPDPSLIKEIKRAVSIPVMARVRIGHFVEAQILEAIGVDYIDESELLDAADADNHINKHNFRVPFACGSQNLGEALMRVTEGAVIIWMQGHISRWRMPRSGHIVETVRTVRSVMGKIRSVTNSDEDEVFAVSKKMGVPHDIVAQVKQMGRLPVVQFAGGGIVTPADAALMMQLGCDGVFVGSEIFNCLDPSKLIRAIVQAVRHYNDSNVLAESSCGLDYVVEEDNDIVNEFLE